MALDNRAPAQYAITGVPETFIVGPDGNVAYVHIGPLKAERLREELDSILAQ
jgi:cytochrome c biogenesis protein CcmG/thiol:disulfide interchange protein DsbE